MRELFSHDPVTGMTVWFDYNELTDETTLEYSQDVEPILEFNKSLANDPEVTKHGIKNEMWLYASIPNGIAMKWLIEEGLDIYDDNAWPQISRKLNDPQYAYLKATHKRHEFKG
jgi:hypothetical protein